MRHNGTLTGIELHSLTFTQAGEREISTNLTGELKAMLWSNMDDMIPLADRY